VDGALNNLFEVLPDEAYSFTQSTISLPEFSPTPSTSTEAGSSQAFNSFESGNESETSGPRGSKKKRSNESEDFKVIREHCTKHLAVFTEAVENNKVVTNKIVELLQKQQETDLQILDVLKDLAKKD